MRIESHTNLWLTTVTFLITACWSGHNIHAGGLPANPEFKLINPGNTGIPGQNDMLMIEFGPDGRVWTHGRDFFWGIGGVAALDLGTGLWHTYSSAETPLNQWCYGMAFAEDGSAWIASEDVVAHLSADGETMTAYTPDNSVLVEHRYEDIAIAPNGHVWTANPGQVDLGGGLFEFNGEEWIKHEEPWMINWTESGIAPALNVIARSNGDVISRILSSPACMARYRSGTWEQITDWPMMIDLVEAADGTMYGVDAFATWRFNDKTDQWEQIGQFGSFKIAIDENADNIYLIDNSFGVVRHFNGTNWSIFAGFPGRIDALAVAPNGDVWVNAETWTSHAEMFHFNAAGVLQRVYTRSNTGMITYFPPGMHLDDNGMMWFMDGEYGAARLEPNENWRNFGIYNGGEETYPFWTVPVGMQFWLTPGYDFWTESIDQIAQDTQGNFWFRGPNIIARSTGDDLSDWRIWEPGESGFPFDCTSIGQGPDGTMWLGTNFVAMRLEEENWIEVPIGIQGQFAPVHGWTTTPEGKLWVARVGTFYEWDGNAFVPVLELPLNIGRFEFAPDGTLWISTSQGLHKWDGNEFTIYTPANSALAETAIVDLDVRQSDGLLAVSTSQQSQLPYDGGVALYDPATDEWVAYNYGESFLPFYAVGEVEFDANGDLWIAVLNYGTVKVLIGEDPALLGDINSDGELSSQDRAAFCAIIGTTAANRSFNEAGDLNDDGVIDHLDLAMLNDILPVCEGDIVTSATLMPPGDAIVSGADLAFLLNEWGSAASCADLVTNATLSAPPDGIVDGADLAALLSAWGDCPMPTE